MNVTISSTPISPNNRQSRYRSIAWTWAVSKRMATRSGGRGRTTGRANVRTESVARARRSQPTWPRACARGHRFPYAGGDLRKSATALGDVHLLNVVGQHRVVGPAHAGHSVELARLQRVARHVRLEHLGDRAEGDEDRRHIFHQELFGLAIGSLRLAVSVIGPASSISFWNSALFQL